MHAIFDDRRDAGRRLGHELLALELDAPIVLALPRGGVPVAAEVARILNAPLDLLFAHKIGAPFQPELAIAAVAEGIEPVLEIDEWRMVQAGATIAAVRAQVPAELQRFERQRALYLGRRARVPVAGRTVVLIDDGIATGTTTRAALRSLRRREPARIVLAVPVAPREACIRFAQVADDFVCLVRPRLFEAVGAFYREFEQVTDEEVVDLIATAAR
jgi:putative phosphoribosyl transferase